MREISKEEFQEILEKHKLWLDNKEGGERADLSGVDLSWANLHGVNLAGADLYEANLHGVNLAGADLYEANLRYADLHGADLTRACLCWTNLRQADLSEANLNEANLNDSNLYDAGLQRANLTKAKICHADLSNADFRGAILDGADLDFSSLPLWCGSLGIKADKRIATQIAYHLCSINCDDKKFIAARNSILDFANEFHRVEECGELKLITLNTTE
jgi:uncharacterized protein YjbI with pentapeptide repeats